MMSRPEELDCVHFIELVLLNVAFLLLTRSTNPVLESRARPRRASIILNIFIELQSPSSRPGRLLNNYMARIINKIFVVITKYAKFWRARGALQIEPSVVDVSTVDDGLYC